MPLPEPELGLVVRYEYVWHRQRVAGTVNADQDHPACVAAVFEEQGRAGKGVLYLPISHTPPSEEQEGIEIPSTAARRAGLDDRRQWILISECNRDLWPMDIRQRPGKPGVFHYGHLPPKFWLGVKQRLVERAREGRLTYVNRM